MERVRRHLRNLVAGWLALEAAVGFVVAVGFALDGRYTEAIVVLVLIVVLGRLSWRAARRRGRERSRDTA